MKIFVLIAFCCSAMMLMACGGGDSSAETAKAIGSSKPPKAENENLTEPHIAPLRGPVPKKLVIKDLKVGPGPAAKVGDVLTAEYLGVNPKGKVVYSSWDKGGLSTITFKLGAGKYFPGWDEGVKGMKAGGRREIIFPANLTAGGGPLIYVVDVLRVKQ